MASVSPSPLEPDVLWMSPEALSGRRRGQTPRVCWSRVPVTGVRWRPEGRPQSGRGSGPSREAVSSGRVRGACDFLWWVPRWEGEGWPSLTAPWQAWVVGSFLG